MRSYPLTEDHIRDYQENGFIALPGVLTSDELSELRAIAEEILDTPYEARVETSRNNAEYEKIFVQKVNLWRVEERVRKFSLHPRLAEIARKLAGAEHIRIWHDHLLTKKPGDSKPTAWHQDRPYWPHNDTGQLSIWIALQDVDTRNGCMGFVPGSHRLGPLAPVNLVNPQDLLLQVEGKSSEDFQPVYVPLKAGDCTFHNALTFHGAGANTTDQPRFAFVVIYMPDGTLYTGSPHVVTDGMKLPVGEPFSGELFPIVG